MRITRFEERRKSMYVAVKLEFPMEMIKQTPTILKVDNSYRNTHSNEN